VTDRDKSQDSPSGFQVRDRRRFDASGEARSEDGPEAGSTAAAAETAGPRAHEPHADVPVTFSTFLLGLSTQALLHLGEIPNPASGQVEPDLAAAKHVIDILGVLETKTHGNLDEAEQGLMESVLYDLRIRYVDIVRRQAKERT
jgi:hypothetical protein